MRLPTLALLAALLPGTLLADDTARFADSATAAGVAPADLLARLVTDPMVTAAYATARADGSVTGTLVDFARDWAVSGAPATAVSSLTCAHVWTGWGQGFVGYGYGYDPLGRSYVYIPGCDTSTWHDPATGWSDAYGWYHQNQ